MGSRQSHPLNIQILKPQSWIQAGQDEEKALFSNVNPYRKRLLANIVTHELIQEYQLNFIAQQDLDNFLKQLSFRQLSVHNQHTGLSHSNRKSTSLSYIYPIRYFVSKFKNQMCGTILTGYLYIDKVDLRLKEINDIPFPDLLYMYKAALNGFKSLYQKVGYFDIQEQMIFITKKGQVKVWMNANLSKNYPNFQKNQSTDNREAEGIRSGQTQSFYGSQSDMIKDLIYLIDKNSDQFQQDKQVQLFSQYLAQKNIIDKLSFEHCLQQFQMYLHQNNLHSPNHMKSIPQLFSPDEHSNNNITNYQQSHVNQVTTHHLHQMKKKFQPMQAIIQDQKSRPSLKNIQMQNHVFPPKLPVDGQKMNVVRSMNQRQYAELNNSRYSCQSNNQNKQYHQNIQTSSNSSNNYSQNYYPQPNTSNMNYRNQVRSKTYENVSQPHYKLHSQPHILPQNVMIWQRPLQNNEISFMHPQVQSNEHNQNIFMLPLHPSFGVMGGSPNFIHAQSNNIPLQQNQNIIYTQMQQQPVFVPPPHNFVPHHSMPPRSNNRVIYQPQDYITANGFATTNIQSDRIPAKQPFPPIFPPSTMPPLKSTQTPPKSTINHQKQSHQIIQKSKIKYFTTQRSYQLDQEIANDLQKFLGLKVN